MTTEYNPGTDTLIRQAASDVLELLNVSKVGSRVTKFVRAGNRLLKLQISEVREEKPATTKVEYT